MLDQRLYDFANLPPDHPEVATVLGFLLAPALNAISRRHEREADRYAWENIPHIEPFVSSMQKLADQNLAERAPSRVVEVLFHSHPSIGKRITAAEEWARRNQPQAETLTQAAAPKDFLHPVQVFFGIDTHGVERRLRHINRHTVIQKTKLFQPLGTLQLRLGPSVKGIQRCLAVGVEAKMLVVTNLASAIAIERNRGPRKIQRLSIERGYHLHCIGIVNVLG